MICAIVDSGATRVRLMIWRAGCIDLVPASAKRFKSILADAKKLLLSIVLRSLMSIQCNLFRLSQQNDEADLHANDNYVV